MRKKVVGYVRVSTNKQMSSLRDQKESIQKWCVSNDYELVTICQDVGVSGYISIDKRKGLASAMSFFSGVDYFVVTKRDRLARNVLSAAIVERECERSNIQIVSLAGEGTEDFDPSGKLMRTLIDAFAEYERAVTSLQIKTALHAKKERGERVGSIPFGFDVSFDGVQLQKNKQEQITISIIKELRDSGMSFRSICDELNKRGIKSRGKKWHTTTIVRILKQKKTQPEY